MEQNNMIGIVGTITETLKMILDAPIWEKKVFETVIESERLSGVKDSLILKIPTTAAGSKKMLEKFKKGTEVLVIGEVQTENVNTDSRKEAKIKIFISATTIIINDPAAQMQNEVRLQGYLCSDPRTGRTQRGILTTNLMLEVSGGKKRYFIPCVCWRTVAQVAAGLKRGDYVEIIGRMQSREYKRKIEEDQYYLMTAYEVAITNLGIEEEVLEQPDARIKEIGSLIDESIENCNGCPDAGIREICSCCGVTGNLNSYELELNALREV